MSRLDERIPDEARCGYCGWSMTWQDCEECGGEGYWYPHEVSPIEYDPDEAEPCQICLGDEGWYRCDNPECRGALGEEV